MVFGFLFGWLVWGFCGCYLLLETKFFCLADLVVLELAEICLPLLPE